LPRRAPSSPAGPRRGESVREWYFGLGGPSRYRVVIEDGAVPGPVTVWAMSPGEALDAVIVDVDARERVNVSGAPAHVEHAGLSPEPRDLKATDEAWPFAPAPRPPRFDRQDFADALFFIALIAVAGAAVGLYTYALLSIFEGEWLRAVLAAGIATLPAAGLAIRWLKA
jgi:hypothetical protein